MGTEKAKQDQSPAGRFLTFDYVEAKDLGKLYLTLVAGLLAFSVSFADKIATTPDGKSLLFVAQILYLGSVMICMMGLWILYYAGRYATHSAGQDTFKRLATTTTWMWIATAICFGLGNVFLLWAGHSKNR